PAGLNAALVLGRAQRRVLVADTGEPRNAPVRAMHGFLSRDGTDPMELRHIAREQLGQYTTVELRDLAVETARRADDHFELLLDEGTSVRSRRVLLATGVMDELPAIPGLAEHWGRGVFNCPYCDGWEVRNQPLGVLGGDVVNVFLALNLVRWSNDLVLFTNGTAPDDGSLELLDARNITLRTEPVVRIEGDGNKLQRVILRDAPPIERHAMFSHPPTRQRSALPQQLGCTFLDDGSVLVDDLGRTSIDGVSAVGDMARRPALPFPGAMVIVAAADGAAAAVAIDQELFFETLS
ncbi:MAG TPA: NAD(P)/FAD-dependent oxidoreductase, partial [Mycobacterium sp.]|nr:NAD(P)/FAD-dependent oxidoreductase [Mycobacterium sp.]